MYVQTLQIVDRWVCRNIGLPQVTTDQAASKEPLHYAVSGN